MRVCPDCNNSRIRAEAVFCDLCGTRLPQASQPRSRGPLRSPPPHTSRAAAEPTRVQGVVSQSGVSPRPVSSGPSRRRPPKRLTSQAASGPRRTWQDVETLSELPKELNIQGTRWVRVDELELRNLESETEHNWSINETRHIFQERGSKSYPDGHEVSCRGYLHKGGFARFTIRSLAPNAPLAIVRQVWAEGYERGELFVGDYTAGTFQYADLDIHRPMRNRIHTIPRSLVKENELTVEQEDLGSEIGLCYFRLWFYQPGEAVDALSSAAALAAATGNLSHRSSETRARVAPSGVAMSWDGLKKMGKGLPERLKVANKEWELIDFMSFDSKASLDEHSFAVYEAENYFTFKLKSSYPDGEVVEDSGIRWDKGHAEWTVGGTTADHDLVLLIRIDYREGSQEVDVFCDEEEAGSLYVDGRDPVHRWRNWIHMVPGRQITEGTARIRFQITERGSGMNMFRLWFYRAL